MAPTRPGAVRNVNTLDDAPTDASGPVAARHDAALKSSTQPSDKRKQVGPAVAQTLGHPQSENTEGIAWDRMPLQLLQHYRSAHLLHTPSASSYYSSAVLSGGIGKKSPSHRQRQSQDSLASVVRRHFNNQATNEHEVIVNFLYTVKNYDKSFRQRFPPR